MNNKEPLHPIQDVVGDMEPDIFKAAKAAFTRMMDTRRTSMLQLNVRWRDNRPRAVR